MIDWKQVNQSGFGDPSNTQISTLDVFNDQLYAGTWNLDDAQVWRSDDNLNWTQFTPTFSAASPKIVAAEPFKDWFYIGTEPLIPPIRGEFWRTDGNAWQLITANGFGDSNNFEFSAFAVFADQLYVATGNTTTGIEIWRSPSGNPDSWQQVNDDGFDGTPTLPEVTMQVFNGYLYAGISRTASSVAELWRTTNGATWTPVFTDGLGDANNTIIPAMEIFKGKLYLTLRNTTTGGQLWASTDGMDWTPVFQDGLGDSLNNHPYGLIEYEDYLYLVFSYFGKGAEVWRSGDGSSWVPIMTGGWGDENNKIGDYFDRAAVVFKGSLFIGTSNDVDGGEIWQKLHPVYLPVISRGGSACGHAPTLIAPANGSNLNTITPLYQWDSGYNPQVDIFRLEVALDPGFTDIRANLFWWGQQGFGDFRFSRNLDPATTYYWRTFLMCGDVQGPYSQVWSFKTGSNGVILPPPALVAPPDGSTTPGIDVTLDWSPVNGSIEYLWRVRMVGDTGYTYGWTTDTQREINWLDPGLEYEWWVSGRNDYAIGADSQTWQFSLPPRESITDLMPQKPDGVVVIDGNGNEYILQPQGK